MSIKSINSYECLTFNTHRYRFFTMKETLAIRLKQAMKLRNNMTQAALAEASGVAQPTIWRLTSGRAKGSVKLVDIANALGVNVDWLANGTGDMEGSNKSPAIRHDKSSQISVWNELGDTGEFIVSPIGKSKPTYRAYITERNSGCIEAPAGSIVVIDTSIKPGTKDLVIAKVKEHLSVYRFIDGGSQGFLAVDDDRVPLISLDSAELIGVVIFLVRDFRR